MMTDTIYEYIGGEKTVKQIVDAYLRVLTTDPNAKELRQAYPEDLSIYEARMFEFLTMWWGGPALYTERHGMPMIRETHRHLPITRELRDQWMYCMRTALEEVIEDVDLRLHLESRFWQMASSMTRE